MRQVVSVRIKSILFQMRYEIVSFFKLAFSLFSNKNNSILKNLALQSHLVRTDEELPPLVVMVHYQLGLGVPVSMNITQRLRIGSKLDNPYQVYEMVTCRVTALI